MRAIDWPESQEPLAELEPFYSGRGLVLDAWGNPLRYRCPGLMHMTGWDLYSFGPDGRDDEGRGDDLVFERPR